MKIISSLTFFLLCSVLLYSQGIYMRGFVVRNQGDTLRGWIKYGNWKVNPEKIEFKDDLNSRRISEYTVNEITCFEITGLDDYKKATVSLDMNSVDPVEIFSEVAEKRDTVRHETLFLRVLSNAGKLHLYEFVDFKNHFFIQAAGDTIEELIYQLRINRADNIVNEWNRYREQLRGYAGQNLSASLDREIEHTRYSSKSLVAIVTRLNGDKNPIGLHAGNEGNTRAAIRNPQIFVSAGAALTSFSMPGDNNLPQGNLQFKNSVIPIVSAGIDLLSPRNFNDFTLRFEMAFSEATYNGSKHTEDVFRNPEYDTYSVKQRNLGTSLSLLYNVRRTKKVRYYFGAGVGFNFSGYSGSQVNQYIYLTPTSVDTSSSFLQAKKFWEAFVIRAGVRLNRKLEIAAQGNLTSKVISYLYFSGYIRTYGLRLAYFLY
ncbi:MAG: hypothetical protein P4L51_01410 [Puia sp.]|nr:hypothetical protein [Puia sp.]